MRGQSVTAALAILLTILPALNSVCDLGCAFGGRSQPAHLSASRVDTAAADTPPCPLHAATTSSSPSTPSTGSPGDRSSAPRGCGHDHVSMRAVELGATFQLAVTGSASSAAPPHAIVDAVPFDRDQDSAVRGLARAAIPRQPSSLARVVVLRV